MLPNVSPLLDENQVGFRWGAEEQIYTRAETLPLRARKRTFCAFVDVRKAFDVASRRNSYGSFWTTSGATRVPAFWLHGSQSWEEHAKVRQDSVLFLGPLLFNILFDGVSAAVRAACPGVALGPGCDATRVAAQAQRSLLQGLEPRSGT